MLAAMLFITWPDYAPKEFLIHHMGINWKKFPNIVSWHLNRWQHFPA